MKAVDRASPPIEAGTSADRVNRRSGPDWTIRGAGDRRCRSSIRTTAPRKPAGALPLMSCSVTNPPQPGSEHPGAQFLYARRNEAGQGVTGQAVAFDRPGRISFLPTRSGRV
jgi:hypothetical protein